MRKTGGKTMKPQGSTGRNGLLIPALVLLALVLSVFGDALFSDTNVLSKSNKDLYLHGIHWMEFARRELLRGNLPLWNPHTTRDDVFAAMNSPAFDPARTVILEESPDPKPVRSARRGTARVARRREPSDG